MLTLTGRPGCGSSPARNARTLGGQLRITDADGPRVTASATNTTGGQLPDLELRHRQRARAEDRIRCVKDTGLRNRADPQSPVSIAVLLRRYHYYRPRRALTNH